MNIDIFGVYSLSMYIDSEFVCNFSIHFNFFFKFSGKISSSYHGYEVSNKNMTGKRTLKEVKREKKY